MPEQDQPRKAPPKTHPFTMLLAVCFGVFMLGSICMCVVGAILGPNSQPRPAAAPSHAEAPASTARRANAPKSEAEIERLLGEELALNWGGGAPSWGAKPAVPEIVAPWYRYIVGFEVKQGQEIWVTTSLTKGPAGIRAAQSICSAISAFVYSNQHADLGLSGVRVAAHDGQRLVWRRSLNDGCE